MDQLEEQDEWADEAADWDNNPMVVAYAEAAWASLQDMLQIDGGMRVLDFGCGTGLLTERLATRAKEVVAVDASPSMVAVLSAKKIPNVQTRAVRWTPDSIDSDPLTHGSFDLIVCSSVCAFLNDYPGAVSMLGRTLRPGGHFVQWDWEFDPDAEEPFGLTREAVTEAIASAGLTVVSVKTGFEVPIEGQLMAPLMGVGRA